MTSRPLLIDDDRYSRLQLIAWWDQQKLSNARVLVVGAGALGNEVLKNLALMGVGQVYIIDFDEIEESNLTRSVLFRKRDCGRSKAETAAEALADLNPDVTTVPMMANVLTEVGLGLISEMDVVVGCLDNREARLWVNRMCWKTETPWVDGGIQEINGVVKVFVPPDSACYECAMTENDYKLINLRYSCPLLPKEDILAGKVPTAPTISSIIAGMQTQEALKLIHDMPVDAGKIMVFNGVTNQFYSTAIQHREDCLSHETFPEPTASGLSAETTTVGELFDWVKQQWGDDDYTLELDRDLVVRLVCHKCSQERRVMKPLPSVVHSEAICAGCGDVMQPERTHRVGPQDGVSDQVLRNVGIPAYDIVRIAANNVRHYVLLDGDRDAVISDGGPSAS